MVTFKPETFTRDCKAAATWEDKKLVLFVENTIGLGNNENPIERQLESTEDSQQVREDTIDR